MTEGARADEVAVDAVGRYLVACREAAAARQRVGKATDVLAAVYDPVRELDREAIEAQARLSQLDRVEEARAEWDEALAQQRDAVLAAKADREASRGTGPAARAARERADRSAYDMVAHRERVAALAERCVLLSTDVGTMDPRQWAELRAQAVAVGKRATEERPELVAQSRRAAVPARDALVAAQDVQAAAAAAVEERAAVLVRLRLDVDRVHEVATHGGDPSRGQPADPATEAALAAWHARQAGQAPEVEAGAERPPRGPTPDARRDVER